MPLKASKRPPRNASIGATLLSPARFLCSPRNIWIWRLTLISALLFAVIDHFSFTYHSLSWPTTYDGPVLVPKPLAPGIKSVYITAAFWNGAGVLANYWNNAIVDLARNLGPENVYVAIHESGSWDKTKDYLHDLDRRLEALGVARTITLSPVTHADIVEAVPQEETPGWIMTRRGRREPRRIPYLSHARNRGLEPLEQLNREGKQFDRIVFLNDLVFQTDDIIDLLNTRDGDYAAVCPLDFSLPNQLYDSFALRAADGKPIYSNDYPYVSSRETRNALKRADPMPVHSCWNGVAIFDAAPFQRPNATQPLRFRGIADNLAARHLEGSECCLIHYDNPITSKKGVWVNPRVRVGYNSEAYQSVRSFPTWSQSVIGWWTSMGASILGLPFRSPRVMKEVKRWEAQDKNNYEPGKPCLVDEMHILLNRGWIHL